MFLNSFIFSGVQIGGDLYVALWGGAGTSLVYERRSKVYSTGGRSGSGGLILAKINGVPSDSFLKMYVGGRGDYQANSDGSGNDFAEPRDWSQGRTEHRYTAGAGGAASAISIISSGGTEQFLIIAPSGGGHGAGLNAYEQSTSSLSRAGGHGLFGGVQLGTAPVAPSFDPSIDPSANPRPSNFWRGTDDSSTQRGFVGDSGVTLFDFQYPLVGMQSERYYSSTILNRGGGGAPSGVSGAGRLSSRFSEGGTGGKGYVAGFSGTYTEESVGTGVLGGIDVEFVAFDGKHNLNSADDRQYDRVVAVRNLATDAGNLVTEITNALGWQDSPGAGNTSWPPELEDTRSNLLSTIDPASLARRPLTTINFTNPTRTSNVSTYWPGQAGLSQKKDSAYGNATLANVLTDFPTFWSNGGAGMLRVGTDGLSFGFQANNNSGAFSGNVSPEGQTNGFDGTNFPTQSGGGSATGKFPASTAGGINYFGRSPSAILGGWTNDLASFFSYSASTLIHADTDNGPITPFYGGSTTLSTLFQSRTNNATLYVFDVADTTPSWTAEGGTSGIPSSSSFRTSVCFVHDTDNFVVSDTAGTQIIRREVDPPTVTSRDATGTVLTDSISYGITSDAFGYIYQTDRDGNLDVFDGNDFANDCPIVLTLAGAFKRTANSDRMGGIAYDHQYDILWYSQDERISWMLIERDANDVPTGFKDFYLNNSANYVARNEGTYGEDDKIFWVAPEALLQQNNDNGRLLSVGAIAPNFDALTDQIDPDDGKGKFVFSMFGAGGGGGGTGDGSNALTEDGGSGGNGAFVEVMVEIPVLEQQNITFGLAPGEGGGGGNATSAGGWGGSGGGASVLWIKVNNTTEPLAYVGGGGGGGGAGESANADAGYGGSAAGVNTTDGNGLQAQDGLGPNDPDAGNSGGGGGGTSAGVKPSDAYSYSTPVAKTVSTNGQRGGYGDNAPGYNSPQAENLGRSHYGAGGNPGGRSAGGVGAGGGGGGGFFAGAGGGGGQSTSTDESGAGGGGGSSNVRTGNIVIDGLTITVSVLRSETGTLQTGAPFAVAQTAGTTKHFSSTTVYGQGGNGGPETSTQASGTAGQSGAILAGHYSKSTHDLLLTAYNGTAATNEKTAREI